MGPREPDDHHEPSNNGSTSEGASVLYVHCLVYRARSAKRKDSQLGKLQRQTIQDCSDWAGVRLRSISRV